MSNQQTGFYFRTQSGNCYFYNDNDGTVTLSEDHQGEDFIFGSDDDTPAEFYGNAESISKFLDENGYTQMLLVVTEKCNLRCKYCIYSGNYDNQRDHGLKVMPFEVAKKAIDRFYEKQMLKTKQNLLNIPLIGFYGGEPLMNFALIKQCVAYAKEKFNGNVTFLVTTNGTLMTAEIADFLAENKFSLSISLNGDCQENDRLRVFANGTGTYDSIISNVRLLRERHTEYFDNSVNFIGCYDWGTNLDGLNRFCKENGEHITKLSRLSLVSDYFTTWYQQFTAEEKKFFFDTKAEFAEKLADQIVNGEEPDPVCKLLFYGTFMEVINRYVNIPLRAMRQPFLPYTGSCVPATKICVQPDGSVHCCEKVNMKRPLGDVENGLNMEAIVNLLKDYYNTMSPICKNCPTKRLCPICYSACLGDDGNFTRSQIGDCSQVRKSMQERFSYVYSVLERGAIVDDILQMAKQK